MILMKLKKLVGDIRIDISNVKVGFKDKEVFNDLNRLIANISNKKVKKEDPIKRLEESISAKARKKYCFSKEDDSSYLAVI